MPERAVGLCGASTRVGVVRRGRERVRAVTGLERAQNAQMTERVLRQSKGQRGGGASSGLAALQLGKTEVPHAGAMARCLLQSTPPFFC